MIFMECYVMEDDFKELKAFVHANVEKLGINFT